MINLNSIEAVSASFLLTTVRDAAFVFKPATPRLGTKRPFQMRHCMNKRLFLSFLLLSGLIFSIGVQAQSGGEPNKRPAFDPPAQSPKQYSVAEIGAMFERPKNTLELLKNLKLAMDKDLLLQKAFFDDANLLKFFNALKVTWEKPGPFAQHQHWAKITPDNRVFTTMIVRVLESRWQESGHKTSAGTPVPGDKRVSGRVSLEVGGAAGFTLREVKKIFGSPTQQALDCGMGPHSTTCDPTTKGSFIYEIRWNPTGGKYYFEKRAVIHFKADPPPDPTVPYPGQKFTDIDLVKSIELYEIE
jgi:hypothetical protein